MIRMKLTENCGLGKIGETINVTTPEEANCLVNHHQAVAIAETKTAKRSKATSKKAAKRQTRSK